MKKIELQNISSKMGIKSNISDLIILGVTKLSKTDLFLTQEIEEKYIDKILEYFKRYKTGEPLEYILENANFYSLDFYVDKRTLVPRNDTEVIVDKALEEVLDICYDDNIENDEKITLLDVGTGTSCIPISIIKNTSKIDNCIVVDISKDALVVSHKNIIKHELERNIQQVESDLLHEILLNTDYKLNKNLIITANLPYIKNNDFENIDKETIEFEPELALYGGAKTGFELYERLIKQISKIKEIHHIKKIVLFIEIGFDQKEYSNIYLTDLGLSHSYFKDNSGIDRCIRIEI